jgi:lysine-ketoglutarate reductase/saccharopine dehydrogenase-like protein (TIGR00300 family)
MPFNMPVYHVPDFTLSRFTGAPDAAAAPAPRDGIAPGNFHSTSMYPEYVKINGSWRLAEESRMDCLIVIRPNNGLDVLEARRLKAGDRVVLGRTEDGSEGIYLHAAGFIGEDGIDDRFLFRAGRSRETAFSRDYDSLYDLLRYEREFGSIIWVLGPAVAFDSDSRRAMQQLIECGFAGGLLAGNALGTHDLEAAHLRTALGQDIYTQRSMPGGHYNHLDVLNLVRRCGSIPRFIQEYSIRDGILYACVKKNVPFVLCGSIRDDGPLPETVESVYTGQDRMRGILKNATTVICLATQLHTIAAGNMTPCYRVAGGVVRPLFIYTVDISEFVVNKLRDRGSLTATAIVTNVQDFIVNTAKGVAGFK